MKSTPVDFHSIIHFINFFIFGYFINDRYALAFIIGIVWEIFEYYITKHRAISKLIKKHWTISKKYWDESHHLNPVYDILFNMCGYYAGNYIYSNNIFHSPANTSLF